MDAPLFTIGIPTFNRPDLLRQAIDSALNQSYPNVEVVVSDNASDVDVTPIVLAFKDSRIRLFRNDRNLGSASNFVQLLQYARGEYFSWLQDDDLLHKDFANRAVQQMALHDASVYVCGAHASASVSAFAQAHVYAPPFSLNWANPLVVRLSPEQVLAFSLLVSIAIPPAMAFRLEALKKSAHEFLNERHLLFVERTLLAHLATHSAVIVDPVIGAIIREHDDQLWRNEARKAHGWNEQWASSAQCLNGIASALGRPLALSGDLFRDIPSALLAHWYQEASAWGEAISLCVQVSEVLQLEVTARQSHGDAILSGVVTTLSSRAAAASALKNAVRRLVPPHCWDALSNLKRAVAGRR